jgi:hypothetical protein
MAALVFSRSLNCKIFSTLENKEQQGMPRHQMQTLCIYWTLVLLGFRLIFSPLTFSYGKGNVQPSGESEV